jgi:hypothetical protein
MFIELALSKKQMRAFIDITSQNNAAWVPIVEHCFICSWPGGSARVAEPSVSDAIRGDHTFVHLYCSDPLVGGQPSDNLLHLLVGVDPEALVLRHARQLHILAVQLLLHDLLQRLENENLGLGQRERLVELILQLCLRSLGSGTDGFRVVAVEGARGLGMVSTQLLDRIHVYCASRWCECVTYRLGPSSS